MLGLQTLSTLNTECIGLQTFKAGVDQMMFWVLTPCLIADTHRRVSGRSRQYTSLRHRCIPLIPQSYTVSKP